MSQKKKKAKKPMNPQVTGDILLGLKTLISNDACIKVSREWKGWRHAIPVVIALGSVVLALVPYFVQQNNVQGSSAVFSAPTGNYENGLATLIHTLAYDSQTNQKRATPINLSVSADGKLVFEDNSADFRNYSDGGFKWFTLFRNHSDDPANPQKNIVFEAFFNTDEATKDDDFFKRIDLNQNPFTGTQREVHQVGENTAYQSPYIAFGKEFVRFRRRNEVQTFTGLTGSYQALANTSLTDLALKAELVDVKVIDQAYINKVKTFFVGFVNSSYEPAKKQAVWMYTGIFFGVDAAAILLFGLMLFLMTRGKKNPFRIYTFWECQKMSYWAALAPAILSLAGFFIPNFAYILFFFLFGFRMMWMSMKSMRPQA